jgi:hypothetical protein
MLMHRLAFPLALAVSVSAAPAVAGQQSTGRKTGARPTHAAAKADAQVRDTARVWPVTPPPLLPGSILPAQRILAFYGNPRSKGMGILGQVPPDSMLALLKYETARWSAADPLVPVQPALQLIAVIAQADAGRDGMYRARMDSMSIEREYQLAHRANAILILDVQVGLSTLQKELPRLAPFLSRRDVHLAIDPEFSMKHGGKPGKVNGTFSAEDVNYASRFLRALVDTNHLPPKVLVVHRWTRAMLTDSKDIELDPRVQIVIDMDGWGTPARKRDSYRAYVQRYPVEFTGFKLFYRNDSKRGSRLMTPLEVLSLWPRPLYIQYQ